jgi:hypothetical protein
VTHTADDGRARLAELIGSARSVVALTGAGISVPSGIPDFRSPGTGLWENVDPMEVAHISVWRREPARFWGFYGQRFATLEGKQPNGAHRALVALTFVLAPLVAVGAGGTAAELLGDVQVRLAPVGPRTAGEMLRGLRTFPLLDGYRGAPPSDVAALEDVLRRLGTLAEDLPQVIEMDCNPVKVLTDGACIVDARIRVAPVDPPRPLGARR